MQYRITLFLVLLLTAGSRLNAQYITNTPALSINNYELLPDSGYSFKQILLNAGRSFKGDTSRYLTGRHYWAKIVLNNPYPNHEYYVITMPHVYSYTLYYYTGQNNTWTKRRAGLNIADGQRLAGTTRCVLLPQTQNILYLQVDMGEAPPVKMVKPAIKMEKQVVFNANEQVILRMYLLCVIALVCFLLYNFYLYLHLKDKAYNHYVTIQIGALLYLTGMYCFFNVFIPLRLFYLNIWPDGFIRVFDINNLSIHVGVVLILGGLCFFTRAYLRTKTFMPRAHRVLAGLSVGYAITEVIAITMAATRFYSHAIIIANLLSIAIILSCLICGVLAYRQKVSMAKHFLIAITLPALLAILASINIILYNTPNPLLPVTAILSQIITFGVALVARVKEINDSLKHKAIEAIKLEAENAAAQHKQLAIEQENEIITLNISLERERNLHLQQVLEAQQRELVGNSLHLQQKNKLLADLTRQLNDIDKQNTGTPEALRDIRSSLNNNTRLDGDWDRFKLHFEQVHPDFFKNLQATHPQLTKNELRLCAYFHINLSTKEIASLLNIAPASVRQAKTRLHKKINL